MAGKVGHINIFGYQFTFVFRHRFEKKDENNPFDNMMTWREWELGFWFKRYQVVGKRNFHKPDQWDKNLVYEYMFGVELLWCKAWFTVQRGAMVLNMCDVPKVSDGTQIHDDDEAINNN